LFLTEDTIGVQLENRSDRPFVEAFNDGVALAAVLSAWQRLQALGIFKASVGAGQMQRNV